MIVLLLFRNPKKCSLSPKFQDKKWNIYSPTFNNIKPEFLILESNLSYELNKKRILFFKSLFQRPI